MRTLFLVLVLLAAIASALLGREAEIVAVPGTVTVDAPSSLRSAAERIRAMDLRRLSVDLGRAGLALPDRIDVTLVPEDDSRARRTPAWIVGLATGASTIVIFPERVLPYPYDSLESVFRHEVAHLSLDTRAGGQPLPRWFHEGVAMSVDTGWDAAGQLRLILSMVGDPGTAALSRLFAAGTESEASEAYGLSAALVADVRRRHGEGVPGAIAARVQAGLSFDRAFRLEVGVGPDEAAVRAWSGYRRWVAWMPAVTSTNAVWGGILVLAFVAFIVRGRQRARQRQRWDEESHLEG